MSDQLLVALVKILNRFEDLCFAGAHNGAIRYDFVYNEMNSIEVQHNLKWDEREKHVKRNQSNIELADVIKIFVKRFNKKLNKLHDCQIILETRMMLQ